MFLHGHGFWTSVENVVVGPFIAIISFVCSIGNVPLAAALWHGGISFGGVISFIFADLITFPLLLIYRRYYGTRLTLRMLVVFWAVMSIAGLVTEGIFTAAGLVPTSRPTQVAPGPLLVELHHLSQHRLPGPVRSALLGLPQPGAAGRWDGYALDPVCGMQVETAHAPASAVRGGGAYTSARTTARTATSPERCRGAYQLIRTTAGSTSSSLSSDRAYR